MTYFTDSVYEKMMVQKPIYGREKTSPARKNIKPTKLDKRKQCRGLIIPLKKDNSKEHN